MFGENLGIGEKIKMSKQTFNNLIKLERLGKAELIRESNEYIIYEVKVFSSKNTNFFTGKTNKYIVLLDLPNTKTIKLPDNFQL